MKGKKTKPNAVPKLLQLMEQMREENRQGREDIKAALSGGR